MSGKKIPPKPTSASSHYRVPGRAKTPTTPPVGPRASYRVPGRTTKLMAPTDHPDLGSKSMMGELFAPITAPSAGKKLETKRGTTTPTVRSGTPAFEGVTTLSSVDEMVGPLVESQQTIEMFESTLFESFSLLAEPTYNFFVEDETTVAPMTGSLEELPRYVTLSWKRAPRSSIASEKPTKGHRTNTQATHALLDSSGMTFDLSPISSVDTAKSSLANGFVSSGVIRTTIDPPAMPNSSTRFDQERFLLSEDTIGLRAADVKAASHGDRSKALIPQGSLKAPSSPMKSSFKATFIDTGIAGAFSDKRVGLIEEPHHATSVAALSHVAASIETISSINQVRKPSKHAPELPSHPEFFGLQYIGYLLERFIVDENGMRLDVSISLDDPATDKYIDINVLYGVQYAYRIRSIVRWTRGSDDSFFNVKESSYGQVKRSYVCSFYAGDWSPWSFADVIDPDAPLPPEELNVRPDSRRHQVSIAWKIPWDKHRDLAEFVLFKKKRLSGIDTTGWVELGRFPIKNGIFFDSDVPFDEDSPDADCVYAMTSVTKHGNISVLSEQIACSLTRSSNTAGENPLKWISHAGVTLDAFGPFSTVPPQQLRELVMARKTVTLTIRPDEGSFPLFKGAYVIRLISSVTGVIIDVPVAILTQDVIRRI